MLQVDRALFAIYSREIFREIFFQIPLCIIIFIISVNGEASYCSWQTSTEAYAFFSDESPLSFGKRLMAILSPSNIIKFLNFRCRIKSRCDVMENLCN